MTWNNLEVRLTKFSQLIQSPNIFINQCNVYNTIVVVGMGKSLHENVFIEINVDWNWFVASRDNLHRNQSLYIDFGELIHCVWSWVNKSKMRFAMQFFFRAPAHATTIHWNLDAKQLLGFMFNSFFVNLSAINLSKKQCKPNPEWICKKKTLQHQIMRVTKRFVLGYLFLRRSRD